MQESIEKNSSIHDGFAFSVLADRRSRPYVRTRQRKKFDRRKSFRVGTSAAVLFHNGELSAKGFIKDLSEEGACVELEAKQNYIPQFKQVEIPFLPNNKIKFEISWSKNGRNHENGAHICFGAKFLDLTPAEKNLLRKTFLLSDDVLMSYCEEVSRNTLDIKKQEKIKSFFLNDIKVTMKELIDIETLIADGVNDEIIMQKCRDTLDSLILAGEKLNLFLKSEPLIKEIKQRCRRLLGHFIYQSKICKRGFEKPRGYPGDYKTLEAVYDDKPLSLPGIGEFIDRYGMNDPYSVGIKARKNSMKEILSEYLNNSTEKRLKILNLASGGCRDIREMLKLPIRYEGQAQIDCIDQDEEAIDFSREKLSAIKNGNIQINLIQGNILKLESLNLGKANSFDLIYSIGIADYLQDHMLRKIFRDCYRLIKPGGKLFVAYKDKDMHKPLALDWYADWCFVPRNEQELIEIINDAMGSEKISIGIERIDSGVIFFAEVTKL